VLAEQCSWVSDIIPPIQSTSPGPHDNNYQHVNAVVATYPDVKATGPDTFGDAGSIDDSTDDVEEGHEHDPAERGVIERV